MKKAVLLTISRYYNFFSEKSGRQNSLIVKVKFYYVQTDLLKFLMTGFYSLEYYFFKITYYVYNEFACYSNTKINFSD